jgi:Domain of unknown function (DU1801)
MAKNEIKTQVTDADVVEFLNNVEDPRKRADSFTILEMMRDITGEEPKMWGPTIVGFGQYHYKYASGHEGDMCIVGFSPRKQALTVYISTDFEQYDALMAKLGKHTTSKACLYIKRLSDVDLNVLRELVTKSVEHTRATGH